MGVFPRGHTSGRTAEKNQPNREEMMLTRFHLNPEELHGTVRLQLEHKKPSNQNKQAQHVLPGNMHQRKIASQYEYYSLASLCVVIYSTERSMPLSSIHSLTVSGISLFLSLVQHLGYVFICITVNEV